MPAIDIQRWMLPLLDQLKLSRQRQVVSLQGSEDWCDQQLAGLYRFDSDLLLLSDRNPSFKPTPLAKADQCLGSEASLVVLDLFDGLSPDVFCIAGGLLKSSGVLVLLSPRPEQWILERDQFALWQDGERSINANFINYFFSQLDGDAQIGLTLTAESSDLELKPMATLQPTKMIEGQTYDQRAARQIIDQWLARDEAGLLLLSANRGRGKSSCLGQLASALSQADYPVLVTCRSRQAAAELLRWSPETSFIAPDQLLLNRPEAGLLIIDEAAMIPLSMLQQIRRSYRRVIMATTTGGYEGTGQGFRLRFINSLVGHQPIETSLQDPVRWCSGDALEAWIERNLMPNQAGFSAAETAQVKDQAEIELIENLSSLIDKSELHQVYALLSDAHYRTRPMDLRLLMENPNLSLVLARAKQRVVGVAVLNSEGGFEAALCEEVFMGRRRPRGHLLAQMVTAQAGAKNFAQLRGLRIQRIAVDSSCRRQGIGSVLLQRVSDYAYSQQLDYIGASFALDPLLVDFWRAAEFDLVHVSYAQGKSTGSHSIAVLKPLAKPVSEVVALLQSRMNQQLPVWMTQFLRWMGAEETTSLLRYADYKAELASIERDEVFAFMNGNRGFELCFASLQRFVMQAIAESTGTVDDLLLNKAVQNREWDQLVQLSGSDGWRQQQQRLRRLIAALYKDC